jgi:anthranilate phosphoribosyltransferase
MAEAIVAFGGQVDALIKGRSLSRYQAYELCKQVLLNQQPDLQQGAFLAAITAKGATPEEIAGVWEAIYEIDTCKVRPDVQGPLVENCGTGMDGIKTFNISTAAAIVAAAGGVNMAKHAARAITSKCGAVDIAETLGVDVECDVSVVQRSIERSGIGMFNGMSQRVHPTALFRILSQIRFGTILNIAGSLANPASPTYGVRGVHSQDMVVPVAKAMLEIGYVRAFVVHGLNAEGSRGMDEISTLGETHVAELKDGIIENYVISPKDLGIMNASESSILHRYDKPGEAIEFLRILSGLESGPKEDIVCLNAAPVFYITGHASDLDDGLEKARGIIDGGRAIDKLLAWVESQNSDSSGRRRELEGMLNTIS